MSTICKLDKGVREARYQRRADVAKVRATPVRNRKHAFALHELARRLDAIRRNPRHNGARKELRFRALLSKPLEGASA